MIVHSQFGPTNYTQISINQLLRLPAQVGGGGHVEEALVDLTGGVAGRFYTADVWDPWGDRWGKTVLYQLVWLQIWKFCVYHHCCFKTTLLGGFKQVF